MTTLIVGMVLFFGAHLVPMTPLKPALLRSMGEQIYKSLFALVSLAGLVTIIWGYSFAKNGPAGADLIYEPAPWARHVTFLFVLLAFISLAISFHKGRLKLWLKNPMSIAVALWAIGHLIANGALPDILLFGSFLVFALLDIAYSTAAGKAPSFTPKPRQDIIAPIAGVAMYAIFLALHKWLIGVSPFG
ncbi:MAG: NnrU family protein [Hyphomicrobiales bacterium]